MEKFLKVVGPAMPLNRADVDTDQIIPKQFLKRIERTGYGEFAFFDWRKDPDFVTNDPRYRDAPILLAQQNFGCGSSREHAVWALEGLGIRAVIAPSFADIFRNNCSKVGLLTVELSQADVDYLMARAEELPGEALQVDLEAQTVSTADGNWARRFEIDQTVKHNLLNGLDDIGLTLLHEPDITAFEATRPAIKPVLAPAAAG